MSFGAITSIAVDRGGAVEERYMSGAIETLRNTRSVTKTVAGMLIGVAIARGDLAGVEVRACRSPRTRARCCSIRLGSARCAGRSRCTALRGLEAACSFGPATCSSSGRSTATARRGLVSQTWIERSTRPHAHVDDMHDYGYLWWLRSYDGLASYAMSGAGGSRVVVLPELRMVAVVTAENFGRADQHSLTDALISELISEHRA